MTTSNPSTAELRTWAQANGIKVADRGRISADVLDAWKATHPAASKTAAPRTPASEADTSKAKTPTARRRKVSKSAEPPRPNTAAVPSGDAERESRANKADARFAALEQRIQTLESRFGGMEIAASTKPKRLFGRRSS